MYICYQTCKDDKRCMCVYHRICTTTSLLSYTKFAVVGFHYYFKMSSLQIKYCFHHQPTFPYVFATIVLTDVWLKMLRASVFRSCPHGFVCLHSIGENPNYGFTSFDNLLWSMLTTFQLITLDYWEDVYNMVIIGSF